MRGLILAAFWPGVDAEDGEGESREPDFLCNGTAGSGVMAAAAPSSGSLGSDAVLENKVSLFLNQSIFCFSIYGYLGYPIKK